MTATRKAATVAGAIVGTIAYMAPEQARGEEVDERVDIYAFGLILYDLLIGRRRIDDAAGGAVADLQKRLEQATPPVKSVVPEVPEPLNRFVSRCIEPEAAKRFGSTAEMLEALARLDNRGKLRPIKRAVGLPLASAVATALLALTGAVYWYTRPPVQHENVVAVIADIVNKTGDPAFDRTLEPVMERVLDESHVHHRVRAQRHAQLRRVADEPARRRRGAEGRTRTGARRRGVRDRSRSRAAITCSR